MPKIRVVSIQVDNIGSTEHRDNLTSPPERISFYPFVSISCTWRCEVCKRYLDHRMLSNISDREHIIDTLGIAIVRNYAHHVARRECRIAW